MSRMSSRECDSQLSGNHCAILPGMANDIGPVNRDCLPILKERT